MGTPTRSCPRCPAICEVLHDAGSGLLFRLVWRLPGSAVTWGDGNLTIVEALSPGTDCGRHDGTRRSALGSAQAA